LRLAGMVTVVCGIAVMLLSKPPQASPTQTLSKQDLPKIA
jgi:O-acetylserine/cysteine efflux transporter